MSAVCEIQAQTGTWLIDTIAGTERPVPDGVRGFNSLIDTPGTVLVDAAGNTFFADTGNHKVRRIGADGFISTIAGTGKPGYSGDGGAAVAAQLVSPQGLAFDTTGNLYVSDYAAHVVRKIAPNGVISTVAGRGLPGNAGTGGKAVDAYLYGPHALAFDQAGNLYIAEDLNSQVRKITPDGTLVAVGGRLFSNPEGLAIDSLGNLYVSASSEHKIYKVATSGTVTLFAGNGNAGFAGDGSLATQAALAWPQGLALDSAGNLWVCDSGNNRIREIGADGTIQTIIGSGSSGLSNFSSDPKAASVYIPAGIFVNSRGIVTWSEAGNQRIRYYTPSNHVITEIGGYTPPLNITGGPTAQLLFRPFATSSDAAGNIFIADTSNHVVRRIAPDGTSSIFAGTGNANFNGDVGTATEINLTSPQGVSTDSHGFVYIADTGNHRIRQVDPNGRMITVMGGGPQLPLSGTTAGLAFLLAPTGVVATPTGFAVVDQLFGIVASVGARGVITLVPTDTVNGLLLPAGVAASGTTLYIADTYHHRVLKFDGSTTSVFAGTGHPGYSGDKGLASQAALFLPNGVATDTGGNVYVADTLNGVIRMIDNSGQISTLAGTGTLGFSGDKGRATSAQLAFPTSVNIDSAGNIEIADFGNNRIRQLKFVQVVPDVTLTLDTTTKSANHGSSFTLPLTLASVGGFAGPASLSAVGPGGVTVQFSPATQLSIAAAQTTTVTATVTLPASMAVGSYSLNFTVNASAGQHTVSVALTVTDLPQFPSAGVVSAATGAGGGVAPGQIVAIYGQDLGPANIALGAFNGSGVLSTQVSGTQVLFDGKAAPLIYALNGQISAIVPYSVAGKASTQVQVQYNGKASEAVTVSVVDAAPGIFNTPGSTQAAALNADLSINSAGNPAPAGSIAVLFATGEGQTNPGGVDGKIATDTFPKPLLPVSVTIGGQAAEVLYYGAAPFEVAGVMQLNVRIPAGTPSGVASVVLKVGTRINPGSSTISVQ